MDNTDNVINVEEHDYATYIISNAMQTDDGVQGESQIVYQVQEFLQDGQLEGISLGDVTYDGTSYQLVTTDAVEEQDNGNRPKYRQELSAGNSGYWNEDDVSRLLRIYIKHVKKQPSLRGKPNVATWNAIWREFDTCKKFTKTQIKTKIIRLKNMAKSILINGESEKTLWPFWKQTYEIMQLEHDVVQFHPNQPDNWSEENLKALLNLYKLNAVNLEHANSNKIRREIWEKIAKALGRHQYDVVMKFKKLKSKFIKWRKFGMKKNDPLAPIFQIFNEIDSKSQEIEEIDFKPLQHEEPSFKMREKWSHEETIRVLETYIQLLNQLQSSQDIKTRRAVYSMVGKQVNIPTQAIQIKLTSLKGHYKKYLATDADRRLRDWRYASMMKQITYLENSIWTQMDNGYSNIMHEELLIEPEWFKNYRIDVEKRHSDSMQVLNKLLNVLERILET